jgi:hypothetical protein
VRRRGHHAQAARVEDSLRNIQLFMPCHTIQLQSTKSVSEKTNMATFRHLLENITLSGPEVGGDR